MDKRNEIVEGLIYKTYGIDLKGCDSYSDIGEYTDYERSCIDSGVHILVKKLVGTFEEAHRRAKIIRGCIERDIERRDKKNRNMCLEQLTVRLRGKTKKELEVLSYSMGINRSELVREIINMYLDSIELGDEGYREPVIKE